MNFQKFCIQVQNKEGKNIIRWRSLRIFTIFIFEGNSITYLLSSHRKCKKFPKFSPAASSICSILNKLTKSYQVNLNLKERPLLLEPGKQRYTVSLIFFKDLISSDFDSKIY